MTKQRFDRLFFVFFALMCIGSMLTDKSVAYGAVFVGLAIISSVVIAVSLINKFGSWYLRLPDEKEDNDE